MRVVRPVVPPNVIKGQYGPHKLSSTEADILCLTVKVLSLADLNHLRNRWEAQERNADPIKGPNYIVS